jgi:hypothetical protein
VITSNSRRSSARNPAPSQAARALAGLALAACALSLTACKSQDAAIHLTIRGQFLIPASADTLVLDVLDTSRNTILQQSYPLAPPLTLPTDVVIVQAGAAHPTVKINVTLGKNNRVVGRGTIDADFVDGKTVDVALDVLPQ